MANKIQSRIAEAVREYLVDGGYVTEYDLRIGNLVNSDLWFGPLTLDDESDDADFARLRADGIVDDHARLIFTAAIQHVANVEIPTLWYDDECGCVLTSEPQGEEWDTGEVDDDGEPILQWCEPSPYYEVSPRESIAALYGHEVPNYI